MPSSPNKIDAYMSCLADIVNKVEDAYGLRTINSGEIAIASMDIDKVVEFCKNQISSLGRDAINKMNKEAGSAIALLPYVSGRLTFFDKKRLDYSHYPMMQTVTGILLQFTKSKGITTESINQVNKIIQLLLEIDSNFVNYRGGLGYKLLRSFIILVLNGNYVNASVVADFILKQQVVKG